MAVNNVFSGTSSTWTDASNWSAGHAPTTGENGFLTNNTTQVTAAINNSSANTASFNHVMDFTGQVGTNGTVNTYLQLGAVVGNIGVAPAGGANGAGSRLFNWDAGTSSTVINILNTANSGTAVGQAPVKLKGSLLTLNLTGGIISVAALQTENATVSSMKVTNGGPIVPNAFMGAGCNLGTITMTGGTVVNASQMLVADCHISRSGTQFTHQGSGGYATMQVDAGSKVTYTGTGSVNALILTGVLDLSTGGGTISFGSVTIYNGAKFNDPLGRASFVTPYVLSGCSLKDIYMDLGQGRVT